MKYARNSNVGCESGSRTHTRSRDPQDTGAGRSVVDIGTVQEIGLSTHIKPFPPTRTALSNASGVEMDMAGVVSISVLLGGKTVEHDFEGTEL